MWFGTMDGLNRYDGYECQIYKNNPNDSLSLSNNFVTVLYEDHLGELWIGTWHGGLCRYERSSNEFTRYKSEEDNPNSLCGNEITSIFETSQHILWIGCGGGLNRYNREKDNFFRYYPDEIKPEFEANVNFVGAITQDKYGRLWIGTWNQGLFYYNAEKNVFIKYEPHQEFSNIFNNQFIHKLIGSSWNDKNYLWLTSVPNGLYKINLQNDEISQYKHEPENPYSLSDNRIWSIYQTSMDSDELWIGTEKGGLNRFNIVTEKFTHYRHQPRNQWSIIDNYIFTIFSDKSGLMWIGTTQGIDKFNPSSANFKTIQLDAGNIVWAIHESTNEGNSSILWLGTEDGLYSLNRTSGRFTRYRNNSENMNSLNNSVISGIIESHSGNIKALWVSTWNGLYNFNLTTKQITHYLIPTNDPVHNQMYTLCQDKDGLIWIGTQSPYLYSFNPDTKQFNQHGSHYGIIRSLYIDTSGKLWIGTIGNGLFEFDPVTKKENHYRYIKSDLKSISDNSVSSILEDKNEILWIGTAGGLNKFNYSTKSFTCFNEKDGLISNLVRAILEDKRGNLWLSTDEGISKFNPISKQFRNFTTKDGLHHNEFWWGAYMNIKGEMFFGGRNGLTYFHPDSIKDNKYFPPIVLTDFKIYNKSVRPGQDSPLKEQISEVKDITLFHDQSIFSFEFAALEYYKPAKIKYAYKMQNVDPDWVFTDASRRFVTYTQLDPGEYVFRVKASNSDGIWNKQVTSVNITILPPWWKTWWAYTFYVLFILGVFYSIRRYELNRMHLKNQVKLDEVKLKEREETDRMKSRFFANISHEFRTPLTLIKGPVEKINRDSTGEEIEKQKSVIKRNADRLLALINQLLDLSKLEAGKLELKTSKNNIVPFIKGITLSFESVAERKDITLKVKAEKDEITLYFDKEKMTKIMTNLLSNAFKFTPEGGQVIVTIGPSFNSPFTKGGKEGGSVEIKVKDTGIGISEEELPKLFDRFYQVDSSHTREHEGTGIGLALTKELVELHHGKISADSRFGDSDKVGTGWTEFTIELPVGRSHLKDEEIVESEESMNDYFTVTQVEFLKTVEEVNDTQVTDDDKNMILVVEDNADVREFIKDSLGKDFQIDEASNGEQGVRKAEQIIPDLIISDIMMPKMDGNELTRKLKNDEKTSHIPIILLTAKSEQQSKLEGLETGADDYLTKPFDTKELQIRINNLINIRRKLQEKYGKGNFIPAKRAEQKKVSNLDEKFMYKVVEVIENHLSEEQFSIEQFGKEVGMSRMHLHRKLKALTGKSTSLYVRSIRLLRAKQMIEEKNGNVSEISYLVGFSSPAYFTKCFKEEFGIPPSELAS